MAGQSRQGCAYQREPGTHPAENTAGGTARRTTGPAAVSRSGLQTVAAGSSSGTVTGVGEPGAGRFYGRAMTAGDIYTVAGGGTGGLGDGGPATAAEVNGPGGVVVDGAGNLLITDTGSNRVRQVTG